MAGIFFNLPDAPSPPTWVPHFDNTNWTATTGSWDGSKWNSADTGPGGHVINLQDAGAWTSSYRPTKLRISFSVAPSWGCALLDSNVDVILAEATVVDGVGYDITFGSFDIDSIQLSHAGGAWSLTNIEFLE